MTNAIIIAAILVIGFFALRGSLQHLKGEGGCCGGGNSIKEPDKKLDGPIIATKLMEIQGMHCDACTDRVKRSLNHLEGASAQVNLKKKTATVQMTREIPDAELKQAVEKLDYQVNKITSV